MKTNLLMMAIIIALCFIGCSSKPKNLQAKKTVIAGIVENMPENAGVLVVNYCEPFGSTRQFAQNLAQTQGKFVTEHEYVFAQNLTIRYGNAFINLFVFPGDSVFVTIDGATFKQDINKAVTFSGDNAQLNQQLFLWTNYAYQNIKIPEFDNTATPNNYLLSIKQCLNVINDTLEAYSKRTKMSSFMKKWALTDYKFIIANSITGYEDNASKWDVFTDPIFDVFNDNNFQTMYFQYHLSACMGALISGDNNIKKLFKDEKYITAIRSIISKLDEKAPKGAVRDVMLFNFLKQGLEESPALYDSIPELKSIFSQPLLNEKLMAFVKEKMSTQQSPAIVGDKLLTGVSYLAKDSIEILPSIDLLSFLAQKHENKVLYIDVWATWCGPCIEQMKHAPGLHKYFEGKDVVFINLCLDSKQDTWLPTLKKYAVDGENYFLADNASRLFRAENNLQGFPSFLMIDKSGKIYHSVSQPSNLEAAINQINTHLGQ